MYSTSVIPRVQTQTCVKSCRLVISHNPNNPNSTDRGRLSGLGLDDLPLLYRDRTAFAQKLLPGIIRAM